MADATAPAARAVDGSRPHVIAALTGIRAIAALWVLLCHLRGMLEKLFPGLDSIGSLASAGFLGLEVFFVLSGFIISHNYAERLARDPGPRRYRDFMAARIARVYPVHLVTVLAALALAVWVASRNGAAIDARFDPWTFVVNLLAMQGIGPVAWNVPAWSVTLEIVFYLVFPFLAWRLVHTGVRASALVGAVLLLVIAVVPIPLGPLAFHPVGTWLRLAAEFAVGAVAWRVWSTWTTPHRRWDAVAAGCAAVVTVLSLTVPRVAIFVAVPFLVLGLVAAANATGPVRSFLASRPVEWGGRISYSFYLTHVLVLFAVWELRPPAVFAAAPWTTRAAYVAVQLAAILVVAALTYHLVEERSRSWLRRVLSARPPTTVETAEQGPALATVPTTRVGPTGERVPRRETPDGAQ